jgi:hypothetical protein
MGSVMRCILTLLALVTLAHPAIAESFNPDFSGFPHWQYVLEREEFAPPTMPFTGDLKPLLDRLHAKYARVPYKTDIENFGERNHWATRQETREHGAADCKGIAEAELFDLLEAGIRDRDVAIVVVYVRKTGEVHAVTRVRNWVLDIQASRVLTVEEFGRYYDPIFAINRLGWRAEMRQLASRQ